jgi:hypothetical protein
MGQLALAFALYLLCVLPVEKLLNSSRRRYGQEQEVQLAVESPRILWRVSCEAKCRSTDQMN